MKTLYEVFDEFEEAKTKKARLDVIGRNLSPTLVKVLELTYHPKYQWTVKELPEGYRVPTDMLPGITHDNLSSQLRRLYMFLEGHPTAGSLSDKRRDELLTQLLESIEPRDAEIILGILQKDQGVKGLNYAFVKEAFPDLIP